MNIPCKTLLPILLILLPLAAPASEQKVKAAELEAGKWLALVDGRQYQESWSRAATLFRQQVNPQQWLQAMNAARTPLSMRTAPGANSEPAGKAR